MEAKEQDILSNKIKLLYHNGLVPALLSIVVGFTLVATLWQSANHQSLIIWYGIIIFLAIIRVSLIAAFKRCQPTGVHLLKWEKPYAIALFANILTWSVGSLVTLPEGNPNNLFIISIFSLSIVAGIISWYVQIRYIQIGAICLALMPVNFALLTYGETQTTWLGITTSIILFASLFACHLLQKTLNKNLALTYDLEQSIQKANELAYTDALTGLNNRRAFFEVAEDSLTKCQHKAQPVCLITFDIDYFKKINDAFGHAAGDIALQRVASLLTRNLRTLDIASRLGGEEFAIFLPNVDLKKAMHVAEKFKKAIAEMPIVLSRQKSITITASFGVSNIGNTIDELLNHADQAMYKAKNNGRNLVIAYTPALSEPHNQIKSRELDYNR